MPDQARTVEAPPPYLITMQVGRGISPGVTLSIGGVQVPNVVDIDVEMPEPEEDPTFAFGSDRRIRMPPVRTARITMGVELAADQLIEPMWMMRELEPAGPEREAHLLLAAHEEAGTLGAFLAGVGTYLRSQVEPGG